MTQQIRGMPDLVYTKETFRDMYEALKDALIFLDKQRKEYNDTLSILRRKPVGRGELATKIVKALAKVEGRH